MELLSEKYVEGFLCDWRVAIPEGTLDLEVVAQTNAHLREFAREQARRFALTANLLPAATPGARLLEIGSAPYLMSLLLNRCRGYQVTHTNLTHDSRIDPPVIMESPATGDVARIEWNELNVEFDAFPWQENAFDVVMCCEVIEHLTQDPTHMLRELHRVLKSDGTLILTTPNALRFSNLRDLAHSRNIHDRYRRGSVYGAYGRHNREYTPFELKELLEATGFEVEVCRTDNIYPAHGSLLLTLEDIWLSLPLRVRALFNPSLDSRIDMKRELIFISAAKKRPLSIAYPESIFYPLDT